MVDTDSRWYSHVVQRSVEEIKCLTRGVNCHQTCVLETCPRRGWRKKPTHGYRVIVTSSSSASRKPHCSIHYCHPVAGYICYYNAVNQEVQIRGRTNARRLKLHVSQSREQSQTLLTQVPSESLQGGWLIPHVLQQKAISPRLSGYHLVERIQWPRSCPWHHEWLRVDSPRIRQIATSCPSEPHH
jgi:hypothetical protein